MRFQAYKPLAGGAFAPNFGTEDSVAGGSRFDAAGAQGRIYRDRYWSNAYISAPQSLHPVCAQFETDAISAARRGLPSCRISGRAENGMTTGAEEREGEAGGAVPKMAVTPQRNARIRVQGLHRRPGFTVLRDRETRASHGACRVRN